MTPTSVPLVELLTVGWERAPAIVPDLAAPGPDVLHRAVLGACREMRSGGRVALRWYDAASDRMLGVENGGGRVDPDLLPNEADATLEAYGLRATAKVGRGAMLLKAALLQRYDAELWRWARGLAACVIGARRRLPGHRVLCDAFIGQYARTPFGVHLDGASNFAACLIGAKRILLWSAEARAEALARHGALDPVRDRSSAISLDIRAGQVAYWPSRFWHVAEPGDGLSVTLNLAFYMRSPPAERLGGTSDDEVGLPYDLDRPIESLAELRSSFLRCGITDAPCGPRRPSDLAAFTSRLGFEGGVFVGDVPALGRRARVRSDRVLLLVERSEGGSRLAAGGVVMDVPDEDARTLHRSLGEAISLGELEERWPRGLSVDGEEISVFELVQMLVALGAVQIV